MVDPLPSGPSQAEAFDELLRRAAAANRISRFGLLSSEGVVSVGHSQIGNTAGAVWQALSQHGPLTFAALMEEVDAPQSLFFMAIGWLSREDKIEFEPADGDYLIRLTQAHASSRQNT